MSQKHRGMIQTFPLVRHADDGIDQPERRRRGEKLMRVLRIAGYVVLALCFVLGVLAAVLLRP
jgi:hypothetical protein